MRILVCSYRFSPDVGGIETCSLTLAEAFKAAGHQVEVVTQSRSTEKPDGKGFTVLRNPDLKTYSDAVRRCDIVWQNNISVYWLLVALLYGKPCFVTTATWIRQASGKVRSVDKLKKFLLRAAHNLYISQSIRKHVGYPGKIVFNPYDDQNFKRLHSVQRMDASLVFLGRLVSDKGAALLIQAITALKKSKNLKPTLSIIGSGPERSQLEAMVAEAELEKQVTFKGVLKGSELTQELNRHGILVVPSQWDEPFGIVALEGIACGLVTIVSSGGGLPEAAGPCGLVFENGHVDQLSDRIEKLISCRATFDRFRHEADTHLKTFTSESISDRYLQSFSSALQ